MASRRLVAKIVADPASLPAGLTFEEWSGIGDSLFEVERGVTWAIGEWWLYGEVNYGESAAQALPLGYQLKTIQNAAWVASRIESSRRRENLSFSHHAEVASLQPKVQDKFLERAESEHLSIRSLRQEIRPSRNGTQPKPKRIVLDEGALDAAEAVFIKLVNKQALPRDLVASVITAYLKETR